MSIRIEIEKSEKCPKCGTVNGCMIDVPEYDGDGAFYCGSCGSFMPCDGHTCQEQDAGEEVEAVECAQAAE